MAARLAATEFEIWGFGGHGASGSRLSPALLLAVTVSGFAITVLLTVLGTDPRKVALHTPGYAVFFLGLGVGLAAVARLARAGRTRAAWVAGDV